MFPCNRPIQIAGGLAGGPTSISSGDYWQSGDRPLRVPFRQAPGEAASGGGDFLQFMSSFGWVIPVVGWAVSAAATVAVAERQRGRVKSYKRKVKQARRAGLEPPPPPRTLVPTSVLVKQRIREAKRYSREAAARAAAGLPPLPRGTGRLAPLPARVAVDDETEAPPVNPLPGLAIGALIWLAL